MSEYALSAILYGRSSTKELVKKILELKQQLVKIGYNPDEVDYMIMSKTRDRDISKLDAEALAELCGYQPLRAPRRAAAPAAGVEPATATAPMA